MMGGVTPGEIPLGELAVGEVAEGDVFPEGEMVRTGKSEAGFDFFMSKPLNAARLADAIRTLHDKAAQIL